mgnify:CR=1 FL=1
MRIVRTIILIAAFSVLHGAKGKPMQTKPETGIIFFSGTWQQCLDKAKKEKKLVFLDAYADWCGPCKMMKHKTFTDKKVGEFYNKYFLNIALDMEKGEGPQLAEKYQVTAYPTLLFFNSDGQIIGKAVGYYSPKEFIKLINQFVGVK